ncbi:helix-turn-helix domain-containing protein [Egbenema bharatensis]|uniref:helix-turn-helix domain-containing protein n=1 Tax=Egbenema bharatensis TaxID=3463334 RepID=UPI003A88AD93
MKFADAFRETLFRFELTGKEIAERSGLSPAQISEFRNGKNLRIDSVEKILDALPQEARNYMLKLVARKGVESTDSIPLPENDTFMNG